MSTQKKSDLSNQTADSKIRESKSDKNRKSFYSLELFSSKYDINELIEAANSINSTPNELLSFIKMQGFEVSEYLAIWNSLDQSHQFNELN